MVFSLMAEEWRPRAQELCEGRGGRPGLPVPNKPTVSVAVKQQFNQPRGESASLCLHSFLFRMYLACTLSIYFRVN